MLHVVARLAQAALRGQMQPKELRAFIALSVIGMFGSGYAIRSSRRGVWGALKAIALLGAAHASRGAIASALHDAFPALMQRLHDIADDRDREEAAVAEGASAPGVGVFKLSPRHDRHQTMSHEFTFRLFRCASVCALVYRDIQWLMEVGFVVPRRVCAGAWWSWRSSRSSEALTASSCSGRSASGMSPALPVHAAMLWSPMQPLHCPSLMAAPRLAPVLPLWLLCLCCPCRRQQRRCSISSRYPFPRRAATRAQSMQTPCHPRLVAQVQAHLLLYKQTSRCRRRHSKYLRDTASTAPSPWR
jgi:hypothetical protein